jgi:cation:H+ antiporter
VNRIQIEQKSSPGKFVKLNVMPLHIITYVLGFLGIWFGAGLIISSVEKFSHRLKLSSFSVSFLILGMFTSLGELSVGISSVIDRDPGIFVGNLIGASIAIFTLIIPLLAITGRPVKINPEFQGINLMTSLFVISLPVILSFDGKLDKPDGIICLIAFGISVILIQSKRGFLKNSSGAIRRQGMNAWCEIFKIAVGFVVVYFSCQAVVDQTMYFSQLLNISPFFISLMIVSIGTNLPELSLVARSIFFKDNEVAFGDYVGSASYNTLIFGSLVLWYGEKILLTNSYVISLLVLVVGLITFYIFAKSKNTLTRKEGLILLCVYLIFVSVEVIVHFT